MQMFAMKPSSSCRDDSSRSSFLVRWRQTINYYSHLSWGRTLSVQRVESAPPAPTLVWTRSPRPLPCHRSCFQSQALSVLSRWRFLERNFCNEMSKVWEVAFQVPSLVQSLFQHYSTPERCLYNTNHTVSHMITCTTALSFHCMFALSFLF